MMCIAVSFLVMLIAQAVSSGFRTEIRNSLSRMSGDVLISPSDLNLLNEERPVEAQGAYLPYIEDLECIEDITPVVYRAGIVRKDDQMYGVVLKGVSGQAPSDTVSLGVTISRNFSEKSGLKEGDRMLTYFVGEKVAVRQFNVAGIYESVVETDDRHVVYASMSDLQRVNGWNEGQVSAIEISLAKGFTDESSVSSAADEIGTLINAYGSDDQEYVIATSSLSRYPQLFSWLDLIDFNVFFILMLMTVVAGFNMISGLLIMLFENISTIGLLKSLGMTDRGITGVFMSSSAILVGRGMAIGNALAIAFCILQDKTHLLRLDPENYYVSFVPVDLDLSDLLITDVVSFAVIMLLLLIPSLFISRVDPAETVRVR